MARMSGPGLLLRELNPYGTRAASVETDERCAYLYLSPVDDYPGAMRAVWLRNFLPARDKEDDEAMRAGEAPMLIKSACKHPEGAPAFNRDALDLVWFSEGTGVILYEDGEVLAAIPPWEDETSDGPGLQGYARDAMQPHLGTLPLPEPGSGLYERFQECLDFWTERSHPEHWATYRDRLLAHYESQYGKHVQYYALQDRDYPLLGIAEFGYPDEDGPSRVYATIGMANQNMPGVEPKRNPVEYARVEIVTRTVAPRPYMAGLLARMAVYPWLAGRMIQAGDTYESGTHYEEANFVMTEDFEHGWIPAPERIQVDGHYRIRFLLAVAVPAEALHMARVRSVDFVLEKLASGEL